MKESIHGGDIYRNKVKHDFSVNINPLGIPKAVKEAIKSSTEQCCVYPDMECMALKEAISRGKGVRKDRILCTSGASEAFMAITHALRPETCLLPMPSFYGYRKALAASECEIKPYYLKKEDDFRLDLRIKKYLTKETDMLFVTNPNNPTGMGTEYETLLEIISFCREKNITVVIDECFIDFVKNKNICSLCGELDRFENLIIVWAFTKIYAIPGLRLGTVFSGNQTFLEKIGCHLPEWNVSVQAQEAGKAALSGTDYIEKCVGLVETEREFLAEELTKLGIRVYTSHADFLLLETTLPLYENLLKEGILIRDCSNFEGLGKDFYRIAVKKREENEILLEAVRRTAIKGA